MKNSLNQFAIYIAHQFDVKLLPTNKQNGSVDLIISKDGNGDIGLTSENNEITVYGLGGHQHFYSSTNDIEEILEMKVKIISLIKNLIDGKIGNAEFYKENGEAIGGGFIEFNNNCISVNSIMDGAFKIIICLYKYRRYEMDKEGKVIM